jgi:hypothetical protein
MGSRKKVDRDGASPLGVGSGGGVEGNREERAWQSDALGLLLLPRVQLGNDKGWICVKNSCWLQSGGLGRPPWSVLLENKEKRGRLGS